VSIVLIVLLAFAFGAIQALIGGVKLVYGLPCYALFGLAGVVAAFVPWRRLAGRVNLVCLGSALALTGYVVWRALTSPVDYLARYDLFMVLGALLVYLLAAVHLPAARHRLAILWVLLAFGIGHVLVGAVQFKEKQNYMLLPWLLRPNYGYRASGFYICPNHLAGLLEMLALFGLGLTLWARGRPWVRIVSGYATLTCLAGLAITGSRGGWLSVLGGLTFFGLFTLAVIRRVRPRWFWPLLLAVILGACAVVGGGVWLMRQSDHLNARLGEVYDPGNMRILMWQAALKAHELSPMTGTGSGTYLYYGRKFRSQLVQNDPQHVHNDYLELLCEYGYAGCAIMALFLGAHLWSGLRGLREVIHGKLKNSWSATSNELALLLGTLSAFGALALHSIIDFNMHIPANALFVAFFFGLLAAPTQLEPGAQPRLRPAWDWLRLGAPILGIVLIIAAVPRIEGEYFGEKARMALRDQFNEKALGYAEKALSFDPLNPNLYYYLGEAKHNLSLRTKDQNESARLQIEAMQTFAKGLEHAPEDLQLLLKLARTLGNLRRFAEAEEVFRHALEADPNFGNVYAYYGYHYFMQHRLKRAEKLYRKAIELGEKEIAPLGLQDIERYRALAKDEDVGDNYPIEDEPGDEDWEIGEP
jgi:O-antigen ligase